MKCVCRVTAAVFLSKIVSGTLRTGRWLESAGSTACYRFLLKVREKRGVYHRLKMRVILQTFSREVVDLAKNVY